MIVFYIAVVLLQGFYAFTYGLYCWQKKEKKAGLGVFAFATVSIVFPLWMMYERM
jgi:hypothetical protein